MIEKNEESAENDKNLVRRRLIADKRKFLEEKSAQVQEEIRACFSELSQALRARERQLLRQAEAIYRQQISLAQSSQEFLPPTVAVLDERAALEEQIGRFGRLQLRGSNSASIINLEPYKIAEYQETERDHVSFDKSLRAQETARGGAEESANRSAPVEAVSEASEGAEGELVTAEGSDGSSEAFEDGEGGSGGSNGGTRASGDSEEARRCSGARGSSSGELEGARRSQSDLHEAPRSQTDLHEAPKSPNDLVGGPSSPERVDEARCATETLRFGRKGLADVSGGRKGSEDPDAEGRRSSGDLRVDRRALNDLGASQKGRKGLCGGGGSPEKLNIGRRSSKDLRIERKDLEGSEGGLADAKDLNVDRRSSDEPSSSPATPRTPRNSASPLETPRISVASDCQASERSELVGWEECGSGASVEVQRDDAEEQERRGSSGHPEQVQHWLEQILRQTETEPTIHEVEKLPEIAQAYVCANL